MTIRLMNRATALLLVALLLPACGGSEPTSSAGATSEELASALEAADEAQADADAAGEAVAELQAELDDLTRELDKTNSHNQKLAKKLKAVSERMWGSIAGLRESLSAVEETAGAAAGTASSALAEVQAAARELIVLEDRFGFHLKNHGGG